jgi:hypothetical protein
LGSREIPEHVAAEAANTLLRLADRVDPAALLAAVASHLLIIDAGTYSEGVHGDAGLRLELLAYHLYAAWDGPRRAAPTAEDVAACDAAIDVLLAARSAERGEEDEVVRDFRSEAELVRGSAYPDQLAAQIINVQGPFERWLSRRCGVGPRRAVEIVEAIVRAHAAKSSAISAEGIAYADAHESEYRESGLRKPRWATVGDARSAASWSRAYSERLSASAPRRFAVGPEDLAVEPPVTAGEWDGLITLIGLTPTSRAGMAHPVEVRTRPLYVLGEQQVLICGWANALDSLWLAFEAAAREDTQLFDRYQKRRGRALEQRIREALGRLFPKSCIYHAVSYPDPDRGDNATAELDLLVVWEPFVVLVEAKAGQFRLEGRLGDVGRLRTDLQATVGDAAGQIGRVLRYLGSVERPLFREAATGRSRSLRMSGIRRTYALAVTQQELVGHLGARISEIQSLGVLRDALLPVAMSAANLETITRFSSGPEIFLHYLDRRAAIQQAPYTLIGDELNLFGTYLDHRLQLEPLVAAAGEGDGPLCFLMTRMSERFDAESMHRLGGAPAAPEIRLDVPPGIEELLADFRSNPDPAARRVGFELLDLPQDELLGVAATLWKVRATPPPARGILRWIASVAGDTLVFILGAVGLSPRQLQEALVQRALADQYRRRSPRVIGLALDLNAPQKSCVAALWCGEQWTSHPVLERHAREDAPVVPVAGWRPPGRSTSSAARSGCRHLEGERAEALLERMASTRNCPRRIGIRVWIQAGRGCGKPHGS